MISDQNRLDVCVQNVIVSDQHLCSEMTYLCSEGGGVVFLGFFEASPLVVNTIFVKCVLVFYGRELTFRGSVVVYFCILRDPKKIGPIKKACHVLPLSDIWEMRPGGATRYRYLHNTLTLQVRTLSKPLFFIVFH